MTQLGNSLIPTAWLVRTSGNPSPLTGEIQKAFLAVDPVLPIARVRTMEEVIAQSIAHQKFNMLLLTIFGAIALLLAAVGVYSLMSYSVEQSTPRPPSGTPRRSPRHSVARHAPRRAVGRHRPRHRCDRGCRRGAAAKQHALRCGAARPGDVWR